MLMQGFLSFANSPPFSAPLRLFLTAPWFGVLAGCLVMFGGGDALGSRWHPLTLALVHLLTIGFMLQIMLGALIQVLPVVAGASLCQPERLSKCLHPLISGGSLVLAAGFLLSEPSVLRLGALLAVAGGVVFLSAAAHALWPVPSTSPTLRGLKLALPALLITVLLGGMLAGGGLDGGPVAQALWTDLHAAWGLAGWSGVLLAALSLVVVPMFQLTPGYPARPSWWWPVAVLVILAGWSFAVWQDLEAVRRVASSGLALLGLAFCLWTLWLQHHRRRGRADTTLRYWQCGLLSGALAMLMILAGALFPALALDPTWDLLLGILMLVGGFCAFITGMLYKIVPFLAWMHLQPLCTSPPPMSAFLPEPRARRQLHAFLAAFCLLLLSVLVSEALVRLAGGMFALASGLLAWNLRVASRVFHDARENAGVASRVDGGRG